MTMYEYEIENAEKTFIYQGFASISYKQYKSTPVSNAYGMCGFMWRSNYYKHFLDENHLEKLNWKTFEKEHVYILRRMNFTTVNMVDYLQRAHDCKGIAVIEKIVDDSEIYCLKLVYEWNADGYKTCYVSKDNAFLEVKINHIDAQELFVPPIGKTH